MDYTWSAETHRSASANLLKVARVVDAFLLRGISEGALFRSPIKVRYIPIVMPPENRGSYPPRSKVRRKQNLYDCAPQLDYDTFLDGSYNDQLREYLSGLDEVPEGLRKLGAPPEIADAFARMLDRCFAECSDPGREDRRREK